MKLTDYRVTWPAGINPDAPVLSVVQDLDADEMREIDETLRSAAGVGLLEAPLEVFSAVQGVLEFHAARNGSIPRDEVMATPLLEHADEFTDVEREFTDLFLRKHGAASFDEADVGLFFNVRVIVEFDAARRRKNTHATLRAAGDGHGCPASRR